MRLARGSECFVWGSLGVVLYAGAWLPQPDVAAFVNPDITALTDPIVAAFPDRDAAVPPRPIVVAFASPDVATLPNPIVAALPAPDISVSARETLDECVVAEACIDQYLWSVYERAPKLDTIKVPEKRKVTIKKKGKTRTVTKTFVKLVDEDFTWKDPKAAERVAMPMSEYVIGGMDRGFKLTLYRALRAMDETGLAPGITSGFRDDYRQSIASGNKAAADSSFHGGSRRGGYGHGLAADLVSVKGKTRSERWAASETLWKWIDAHGKEFGIGRPYLDRDPPHVAPIDGREYAAKRGMRDWVTAFTDQKRKQLAAKGGQRSAKRAKTAKAIAARAGEKSSKAAVVRAVTKSSKVAAAPAGAKSSKKAARGAKSSKVTAARDGAKPYSPAGSSPPLIHTARVVSRPK